jgi:hypothetical protein
MSELVNNLKFLKIFIDLARILKISNFKAIEKYCN